MCFRIKMSSNSSHNLEPSHTADFILGISYAAMSVIGVLGNVTVIAFYHTATSSTSSQRKDFFRLLFLITAYVDLILCSTLAPVIEAMLINRNEPFLFGFHWFCLIWGIIWETIPVISVFLVAAMSFSRTATLLFPLRDIPNKNVLIVTVMIYVIYTLLANIVPTGSSTVMYKYFNSGVVCALEPRYNEIVAMFYSVNKIIQLGLPFIPISFSCVISAALVYQRGVKIHKKPSLNRSMTQRMLENATTTIIIMTVVYFLFNTPVFINLIKYANIYFVGNDSVHTNYYLNMYFWNIVTIFCNAGNAVCNPFIHLWRVHAYRGWLTRLVIGYINTCSSTAQQPANPVAKHNDKCSSTANQPTNPVD